MKQILFFASLIFLLSCSTDSNEKILGFWKLKSVKTNQEIDNKEQYRVAMDQLIRTTSIEFKADRSFGASIWGDTSFGYWTIKKDSLVINDLSNQNEFKVYIEELTENKLIIVETLDSVVEVLTFVK